MQVTPLVVKLCFLLMKTDIDAATYIEHETEHAYGEEFRQQLQHSMRA